MNISNYFWHFPAALTPKFCDDVIAYANQQEEVMALTGGYGDRKYQAVEKAVLEEGLLNPIRVNIKDMVIVTGNQRSWFAKKHGYTHISAEFVK